MLTHSTKQPKKRMLLAHGKVYIAISLSRINLRKTI